MELKAIDAASSSSASAASSSHNLTAAISFLASILGILYFSALLWVLNSSRINPRTLKKDYSRAVQHYAPFVYVFLVLNSLSEAACSFWLLFQYLRFGVPPFWSSKTGLLLIIVSSCWTTLTAGTFTILFMHPTWSTHSIASVGSQTIWVFLTLCLWIIGFAFLAHEIPSRYLNGSCAALSYCGQVRALFGLSLLEM
ncbi:hypothetical protein GYMLUDRAFT_37947 [Collybiopsis luxurians FD-317 M1]|nr:hypothetical protein GYMLUDRAFT_37947 [Collybiopsis luxurians FD-317 M1]